MNKKQKYNIHDIVKISNSLDLEHTDRRCKEWTIRSVEFLNYTDPSSRRFIYGMANKAGDILDYVKEDEIIGVI